jgi:hypothetical protein
MSTLTAYLIVEADGKLEMDLGLPFSGSSSESFAEIYKLPALRRTFSAPSRIREGARANDRFTEESREAYEERV